MNNEKKDDFFSSENEPEESLVDKKRNVTLRFLEGKDSDKMVEEKLFFAAEEAPEVPKKEAIPTFLTKESASLEGLSAGPWEEEDTWKMLVVDDEEDVHIITDLALENVVFEGKRVNLVYARSAAEGRQIMAKEQDIAVVLLDVVMETRSAGLDLAKFIRQDLKNSLARIVFRTGQPGEAPERKVVVEYDIDDYKTKVELTSDKLFTLVYSCLRTYKALKNLDGYNKTLAQKVKERTEEVRALLNAPTDIIAMIGADGLILDANEAFACRFQKRIDQLVGINTWDLLPLDTETTNFRKARIEEVVRTGKHLRFEDELQGIWFDNCFYPVFDMNGKVAKVAIVARDITERKIMEEDLRKSKKQAESANLVKARFFANMHHEIRTPLNSIIGFSEILLHKIQSTALPKEFSQFLENIHSSGKDLTFLLNDILEISRIEAEKVDIVEKDFDLMNLIKDISLSYESQAHKKGLMYHWDADPRLPVYVRSDRVKLIQILNNLIGNAIKFTPAGKGVKLKVLKGVGDEIIFMVSDEGIGIPEDKKELLFKPFEQFDASTTRRYGGLGLGLAIVKKLVELLDGEITLTSRENMGAVAKVILPMKEVSSQTLTKEESKFLKDNVH